MRNPLVSFCFTTYKRPQFLQKTLEAVRRQTFDGFEVIVSDNDPEQSGRAVVEGFQDERFRYFANEQNLGMKKSFNKSLERSGGDFIVMIADDDPVYPDMLQTLVGLSRQYPGYGLYLGACNWYCMDPRVARLYKIKMGMNSFLADAPVDSVRTYDGAGFIENFFNYHILPNYLWSTCMVQRDVLVQAGGVPDYGTPFLGDYAYLSIMGAQKGCVCINRDLGHQTVHDQNFGRAQIDEVARAAVSFVDYVSARINHVGNWPVVEKGMKRFVGMWTISHLSFLHHYRHFFPEREMVDVGPYEKEIFSIPFVKPFKVKYLLKKYTPRLHDFLVIVKKKISGQ